MNMEFPRRTARQNKARPKKIELPSLLATISAQQATTPTARIQAKAAAERPPLAKDATTVDVINPVKGESPRENSPSFNRLAANLLTRRT
jgi:hypothetical protein